MGTAFLAHGIWARRGRSERARAWMGNEFGGFQGEERWAVLGGPSIGVLCLCCAAMTLPRIGLLLALVAAPVAVLAFALMFLSRMYFIPLPDVIYPRWARPLLSPLGPPSAGAEPSRRSRVEAGAPAPSLSVIPWRYPDWRESHRRCPSIAALAGGRRTVAGSPRTTGFSPRNIALRSEVGHAMTLLPGGCRSTMITAPVAQ